MATENKITCANLLNHVYTGTQNERRLCCHSYPAVSTGKKVSNKEWWNSEEMKGFRKMMIDGEPLPNCKECYYREESGYHSLRNHVNERADVSALLEQVDDDGHMNLEPTFYEHKSFHCNLQCQTCTPQLSSTWAKLENKMYGERWKITPDSEYEDLLAGEMVQGLIEKRITRLNWSGGEPMMMKMHWRIIDKMTELLKDPEYTDYIKSIYMMYNTNMTHSLHKGKDIWEILSPFNCEIRTSMDGVGKTFEMVRDGAEWESTWENWKRMAEHDFQITVNSVFTFPVLLTLEERHKIYVNYDVEFYDWLYRSVPERYPTYGHGMVDMCLWPQHIFDRVVDKAEESLKKYAYDGHEHGLEILDVLRKEKKAKPHIWEDPVILGKMKGMTQYRDNYQQRVKFHDWLEEHDQEAYEWYQSIKALPYDKNENPMPSFDIVEKSEGIA